MAGTSPAMTGRSHHAIPLPRPSSAPRPPMPNLHVCPLSRLHETVTATRASHVVSLMGASATVERPAGIAAERHLFIGVSDIVEPLEGYVLPTSEHIEQLLAFVRAWG